MLLHARVRVYMTADAGTSNEATSLSPGGRLRRHGSPEQGGAWTGEEHACRDCLSGSYCFWNTALCASGQFVDGSLFLLPEKLRVEERIALVPAHTFLTARPPHSDSSLASGEKGMQPMEVEMSGPAASTLFGGDAQLLKPKSLRRGSSTSSTKPEAPVKRSSSQMDVNTASGMIWLAVCFVGIMGSFIAYGIVMEYATSGGRKLHELSLIFVTSLLYSGTAYVGRYVRAEKPTTVAPARLMVLAMTSMGSTYCSVRSLRYVIYPVQVLAKSCKPIPVMLMGAIMGKKYPLKKYVNVLIITAGVAMFMMGRQKEGGEGAEGRAASKAKENATTAGAILLFISLCFDGGTGAYEDKLMAKHHVGPFDLMYNMHLGKAILAGLGLIVLGQINYFIRMCHETGFFLLLLGVSGAFGQVFIFVTISKFGALTCSIMGLARKVVTLVASIYIYGHSLNGIQTLGLVVAFAAMISGFFERKGKGAHGHGHAGGGGNAGKTEPLDREGGSMEDGRLNGGVDKSTIRSLVEEERRAHLQSEAKPLLAATDDGPEEEEREGKWGERGSDGVSKGAHTVTV